MLLGKRNSKDKASGPSGMETKVLSLEGPHEGREPVSLWGSEKCSRIEEMNIKRK